MNSSCEGGVSLVVLLLFFNPLSFVSLYFLLFSCIFIRFIIHSFIYSFRYLSIHVVVVYFMQYNCDAFAHDARLGGIRVFLCFFLELF